VSDLLINHGLQPIGRWTPSDRYASVKHLRANDYCSEGGPVEGEWTGKGAKMLDTRRG